MTHRSIAIIGEGETEWFYFDSLRQACRYPFKVLPAIPQHSDIRHIAKLAEKYVAKEYDHIVCLIDMDRLNTHPKEMAEYLRIKAYRHESVMWIETNPCTEFWFLLHFLPDATKRHYDSYDALLPELQRYMPGYEKTKRYFVKTNLYRYLTENGDIDRAVTISAQLAHMSRLTPEDSIAYSEVHKVIRLLAEINEGNSPAPSKSAFCERKVNFGHDILDFLASVDFSNVKSISKATGLSQSRVRDLLKKLVEAGLITTTPNTYPKQYRLSDHT